MRGVSYGGGPEPWEIVDLENESQGCFGAILARRDGLAQHGRILAY